MLPRRLEERMDLLEEALKPLRQLPERVASLEGAVTGLESKVLQLQTEMRAGFSAISQDLKAYATKEDLRAYATKEDLKAYATKEDLKVFATKEDLKVFATKDELAAALAPLATRSEMLMLHEDLVGRIKTLGDALTTPRPRPPRKK
jgi:hypothetical protein